ncbi:type IV toxin-antitoxin system AbiEi family antitoxin domain-containing protein [Companilactobacillus hulinensis]|uniref:type IV toxin-antitoxin system AbiEi family antitoxin domain-containing protein n=1 Tax=Companilactobacillus hulinensis TaxID=2486007 RepID=UPI000F7BAAAC|nr:hypothetical protein [Companilactobacillus hulinensis]
MIDSKNKFMEYLFQDDNIITSTEVNNQQLEILKNLGSLNSIQNIDNRLFTPNNYVINDYLARQLVLQNGIYCNQTALYLWKLTDSFDFEVNMAFRQGYLLPKIRFERWTDNLKVKQIRSPLLNQDIEKISVEGTKKTIKLYSRERTLIDILNKKSLVDAEEIQQAFKAYMNSKYKDLNKLFTVAQRMNKEEKIRNTLGVIL